MVIERSERLRSSSLLCGKCCANTRDVTQAQALLPRQGKIALDAAGCPGAYKRPQAIVKNWHVATRLGKRRKLDLANPHDVIVKAIERLKASIRAKVEHPIRVLRSALRFAKVRYRGLAKKHSQIGTQFSSSNL